MPQKTYRNRFTAFAPKIARQAKHKVMTIDIKKLPVGLLIQLPTPIKPGALYKTPQTTKEAPTDEARAKTVKQKAVVKTMNM
jgi:hypothetical protein